MANKKIYFPSFAVHRYTTPERMRLYTMLQREDPAIIMSKVPHWHATAFGREAYGMTREAALSKLRQRIQSLAPTN